MITCAQFEEGISLLESCNGTKSGDEYDGDSTLPPFISEAEMDEISSGNEYDAEHISTNML